MKILPIAAAALLACAAPLAAQDVTVAIDAQESGPQISKQIFGQFA